MQAKVMRIVKSRNVAKEDAKKEVIECFRKHKKAYPSDIADELNLDIDVVFTIIHELVEEGRVRV